MSTLLHNIVLARGRKPARRLLAARSAPVQVQTETLHRLLKDNADCAFSRDHGLSGRTTAQEYARAVPVRDYEALRPYVERMLAGEQCVLTKQAPFMFGTTSGTTSQRKFIPINRNWSHGLLNAMRLWLARSTRAHSTLWSGKVLTLVGSTHEGTTDNGVPTGAVSGLTSARVPYVVRQRYVLPSCVANIVAHDTRYHVAARLMFECDVSLAAVPNPTTLLRLAEVGAQRSESIIRGVFDGTLGVAATNPDDERILREIQGLACRPSPARARELEAALLRVGSLRPRDVWPSLTMIGCWLGGTAGIFAQRLSNYYGDVPLRDLGLRATEATMTIPLEDGTASGVPLLHDNYYEFIPESAPRDAGVRPLGVGDLEVGQRYYILLTTASGLYRYDISDVVEVTGRYHDVPLLAFVHKGPDMLNLTGEKVHADQLARALLNATTALRATVENAQAIPDLDRCCYHLLLETSHPSLVNLADAVDEQLRGLNPEYALKRASGRLGPLYPVRMQAGWGQRLKAADVARGLRESQYKWPFVRNDWDDVTRNNVVVCE